MNTIVIRKKAYALGQVDSEFIRLNNEKAYSSQKKFVQDFGWKKIMSSLYDEAIDSDILTSCSLFNSYKTFLSGSDSMNADFFKAYQINDIFAVSMGASIYLFYLIPKGEIYTDIVPWYCADGQVYLGDTWWEQDDEILHNLQSLSVVDFLERYKGWCFPSKKLF
mgnify:CR=1 FL=1